MENYRDELMQDQSFIRCSVLIAELLIKYRNQDAKDNENHKEPDMGSVTYHLLKQHSVILMLKKEVHRQNDHLGDQLCPEHYNELTYQDNRADAVLEL